MSEAAIGWIVAAALAGFLAGLFLTACALSAWKAEAAKNGALTIGGRAYTLTPVEAPHS